MAYETYEESVEGGQPVELYEFTIGATVYRYTSAEDDITYSGEVYASEPMMRTSPTLSSSDEGRRQLELTLRASHELAQRYVGIVPSETVFLHILRFHRGDFLNGISLWKGRIASAKFIKQATICVMSSVSSESAPSRMCPARKCQSLCNNKLYDALCQVTRASFKYTNTVTVAAGNTITVSGISGEGVNWAVGGVVEFGTEKRMVVAQSSNLLTLRLPFPTDPTGSSVDVYAGCDHSLTTCDSKFSNSINFTGIPFVPNRDPFKHGLD